MRQALPVWAEQREGDDKFSARGNAVASSFVFSLVSTVFQMAGSLVSIIILARLLSVEDFGIYNTILPFVLLLLLLVDGGTIYFTLRRPQLNQQVLSTAFWYCAAIGLVLTLILMAVAPVMAWYKAEPRLLPVGLVMALALILTGFGAQYNALVMRCFRNDLRAYAMAGGISLSLVAGLVLALAGAGYWALVAVLIGRGVFMLGFLVGLTGWLPGPPHLPRAEVAEMARLSNAELGFRVAQESVRQSPLIIVSLLYATEVVGAFGLAFMLAITPLLQLIVPLGTVVLPYLSEQREDMARFRELLRQIMTCFAFLMLSGGMFAALFADDLLYVVIGADKMAASVSYFPMLMMAGVLTILGAFLLVPFQALDRPEMARKYGVQAIGTFAVAMAVALSFGTPEAVAWGVMANAAVVVIWRFVVVAREYGAGLAAEALAYAPAVLAGLGLPLLVWGVLMALGGLPALSPYLRLALIVAGFGTLWLAVVWVLFGASLRAVMTGRGNPMPAEVAGE